jgi:two-component system, cell cycle sensor histidine kinase and response regulator CckA
MNLLQSPAATLLVDREGWVTGWNPAAERLLGWAAADVVGQPYPSEWGLQQRLQSVLNGATLSGLPLSCARCDGAFLVLTISDAPLRDDEGRIVGMIEVLTDVTTLREKEARDKRAQQEQVEVHLREAQRLESLGVLAGGIAHDFNNLLTLIMGYANLAELHVPSNSPAQDYLQQIEEASVRAADLCKQMLAYAGKGRYLVGPLDLNQTVRGTAELVLLSIARTALLRLHLVPNLPLIQADATQMQQVIMNLILNASEALPGGEGCIDVETGVYRPSDPLPRSESSRLAPRTPTTPMVYLEVRDTGVGMDAATVTRIFDPFFTTKFTGRGLGLSAVQGIVHGHRGIITVDSTPGQGSIFRMLLPILEKAETDAPRSNQGAKAWQGEGVVLVVDDEEGVRTVAGRLLAALGFQVLEARDGQEALEIFDRQPEQIRLILLDLTMPRMDGPQTLEHLRSRRLGLPVVLMSGYHEQEVSQRFAALGFAAFLQKPFKQDHLRDKIRSVLLPSGVTR